jgi:acyl-CoA synthetase (AMP-forming)/AMP-acid ligase II
MVGEAGRIAMIVAGEEVSVTLTATGTWGRETLDQILMRHAAATPDRLAVVDFVDRQDWTSGRPQSFTYAELAARVDLFASFFNMLGLLPDTVVAVQMPPVTDAVAVLLALSRAGLVAAPMPLALREKELAERLTFLGAKAIVTQADVLDQPLGVQMRDVAAELFNIRFVFCAGDRVPDGLVELDRVLVEAGELGPAPEVSRRGNPADHTATLSWMLTRREGATVTGALPRSHNHWLAAGLMTGIEAAIDGNAVIISPFALAGMRGLGVGFMPWLTAGATLVLGLPSSLDRLVEEALAQSATHILVPTDLARRLGERLELNRHRGTIIAVGDGRDPDHAEIRGHKVIDATVIGDLGVIARRRRAGQELLMPIGPVRAPSDSVNAPVLLETRVNTRDKKGADPRHPQGELLLRGAMVPDHPWQGGARDRTPGVVVHADGFVETGAVVNVKSTSPALMEMAAPEEDRAGDGVGEVDLVELDTILKSVGNVMDAAAIALPGTGAPRIGAVVVPKPGVRFDASHYLAALADLRLGLNRMPEKVFPVPAIARAASGRVMRAGMAQRLSADL